MEPQKLLAADYLDIVFDKRNKEYGGYELRRHYNRRMAKACISLIGGIGALACLSFITANKPVENHRVFDQGMTIAEVIIPIQPPKVIVPPIPPPPPSSTVRTKLFNEIKITDDAVPDDKRMATIKELEHAVVGSANAGDDTANISIVSTTGTSNRKMPDVMPVVPRPDLPVRVLDQMPVFSGDIGAYISSHLIYPENARANDIDGQVVIEFIVNEDGSVSGAHAVRRIGGGCDEEAVRMVSGMPNWKPGKLNGVPVKAYFSLPVKFELH